MTETAILSILDDHTAKWAECAAQYYRQRNGEAGQRCDGYAAAMQAAAQLIRSRLGDTGYEVQRNHLGQEVT